MVDTMLSKRVMLRRNFSEYAFGNKMTEEQRHACVSRTVAAVDALDDTYYLYQPSDIDAQKYSKLHDKGLLSRRFRDNAGAALMIRNDDRLSIQINGADHLLFTLADADGLSEGIHALESLAADLFPGGTYAYDSQFGYLTARPFHAGSGAQACCVLHLPMLSVMQELKALSRTLLKENRVVLEPFNDLKDKNPGDMYLLYNAGGLDSADNITESIDAALQRVGQKEGSLMDFFLCNSRSAYGDQIFRALGILRYARRMNYKEFLSLWSKVRLGVQVGLIDLDKGLVDRLYTQAQDSHLQAERGDQPDSHAISYLRADTIRKHLSGGL